MTGLNHAFCPQDLSGRAVTVMGLGRFGGGIEAVRFLARHGARVTVTDLQTDELLDNSLRQLDGVPIEKFVLGRHDESDFRDCELLVANPAVRPDNPLLQLAVQNGIPLETEITLFWRFQKATTTICVTGSNGKSTTASLIDHLLRHSGRDVWLGGNIGKSLLPDLDRIQSDHIVVLELSSFQLHYLNHLRIRPACAVVTNFSPNHLDWHTSLGAYRSAKQSVLRWQNASCTAVLPCEDPELDDWPTNARRLSFGLTDTGEEGVFESEGHLLLRTKRGEEAVRWPDCSGLPGNHNRSNLTAAVCAATSVGASLSDCTDAVRSFQSLPHRLQFVAAVGERRFYNDSISTTPESTCAAVDAFGVPVVLLAGGYDKQVSLDLMAKRISQSAKAVILMGQTAPALQRLLSQNDALPCVVTTSIEQAVRSAYDVSEPGDIVVLSPGCASYDWFANFEERGERFIQIVSELIR
jgi:UDP-N-acetylmuramoylalanine--D-glutamate ligase